MAYMVMAYSFKLRFGSSTPASFAELMLSRLNEGKVVIGVLRLSSPPPPCPPPPCFRRFAFLQHFSLAPFLHNMPQPSQL